MVKSCYMAADPPIKAHCFCLFRLQREYWSALKTTQSNAVVCQRALGGRYSSLCRWNFIGNPAETCTREQTSWWQSARAELFWKASLEVGVHNDSNEDHQNASDGCYQLVSSSQSFNYKGKKKTNLFHTLMDFWKCTCNGIRMGVFQTNIFDKHVQDNVYFSLNLFQKWNCWQPLATWPFP